MWSNILDKISFWSLFLVVVLLPVFVLPFTSIPTENSKGLLVVLGLAVSIIFWAVARFSDGKIVIPRSALLVSGFSIVVVFLLSALFSSVAQFSLFGTMMDAGSFWFIFAAFLLMLFSSILFKDPMNARMVLLGTIISSGVVLLFQVCHIFLPNIFSLGVLGGKTENLLGSWNALGLFAGMSVLASLFIIEFFVISKRTRWFFCFLILLSLFILACVNFTFIWELLGIFVLIIFVYKISHSGKEGKTSFPAISFAIIILSLLFFMSSNFIGGVLPSRLKLASVDVYPSFKSTFIVAKQGLLVDPILGVGPNRFAELWAKYKPIMINNTQFWDVSFNSGSGLLPTLMATTGALGILAILAFLVIFLISGAKYVFGGKGMNLESSAYFVLSLYLLVACLLYSVGAVLFLLAFAFIGIFIGLSSVLTPDGEIVMSFLDNRRKSFFFILSLIIVMIASAALSFKYLERFASVPYYSQAITVKDIPTAESSISKALSIYQNDLYLRTFSQIYLIKLSSLVEKGANPTDSEKADLQKSFDQAKNGALLATSYNTNNYLNFQMLGAVYRAVGSYGVAGAYEQAIDAYTKASALNPLNPGLKLSLAQVYFGAGKIKEAQSLATEALTLKPDYVDALINLAQIAKSQGDSSTALSYAEKALALAPDNKDLKDYLNSLKNSNTTNPSSAEDKKTTQ